MVPIRKATISPIVKLNYGKINKFLQSLLKDCQYLYADLKRHDFKVWDKGGGHKVTEIDIAINNYLKKECEIHYPDIGWFSEETRDNSKRFNKKWNFIVDPIDGTNQLLNKQPEFVISIALEENRKIVVGAILNPEASELYTSIRGKGARKNGSLISVSDKSSMDYGMIPVSTIEYSQGIFKKIVNEQINISPVGGTAYKIIKIAEGIGPVTFCNSTRMEWDIAAASLILTEAGGKITDSFNKPLIFNQHHAKFAGYIASNGLVHDKTIELMKKYIPHSFLFQT